MKQSKKHNRRWSADAAIRSLHVAINATHDYPSACARLRNRLRRVPKEALHISHQHGGVYFYCDDQYLRKKSATLYSLARKRYCETLLNVLTLFSQVPPLRSPENQDQWDRCDAALTDLDDLIRDFADGNLQLERILLTQEQYAWYTGRYIKKLRPKVESLSQSDRVLTIPYGDQVLSKSEQNIGYTLWDFAVPCHYEEQLQIDVKELVSGLRIDLQRQAPPGWQLFCYQGGSCYWNVPEELAWMNAPGCIWRTYDSRTGCIRIHPDFTIMLADGSLLLWEHEGLLTNFVYRMNAGERAGILRLAGDIPPERLIETLEAQANDRQALERIVETRVLPCLWF